MHFSSQTKNQSNYQDTAQLHNVDVDKYTFYIIRSPSPSDLMVIRVIRDCIYIFLLSTFPNIFIGRDHQLPTVETIDKILNSQEIQSPDDSLTYFSYHNYPKYQPGQAVGEFN